MIIDELFEAPQLCPECGGISFSDLILAEKKDACYHKVKASAKVWPSAYASGRLVQCRKKGAANYGNKSEGVAEGSLEEVDRRGFLKGLGAAAVTSAAGSAMAKRNNKLDDPMAVYLMAWCKIVSRSFEKYNAPKFTKFPFKEVYNISHNIDLLDAEHGSEDGKLDFEKWKKITYKGYDDAQSYLKPYHNLGPQNMTVDYLFEIYDKLKVYYSKLNNILATKESVNQGVAEEESEAASQRKQYPNYYQHRDSGTVFRTQNADGQRMDITPDDEEWDDYYKQQFKDMPTPNDGGFWNDDNTAAYVEGSAEQGVAEVSLGDYRKKAQVSQAGAKINRFFDRDNPEKVARADQTIAKRERGLARADARSRPYTASPVDMEKQRQQLTDKYPNIDQLVSDAEKNRDPYYDRAEGNAYYAGREAEQNYVKLKQIQRIIQGLNEETRQATVNTPAGNFTANITKDKSTNTVSGTMPVGGATLSAKKDLTPGGAQSVTVDTDVAPNLNLSATRKSADYNKGQLAGTKSVAAKYTDTTGALGEPGQQHTATRTAGVGFGGASGSRVGKNYVTQIDKTLADYMKEAKNIGPRNPYDLQPLEGPMGGGGGGSTGGPSPFKGWFGGAKPGSREASVAQNNPNTMTIKQTTNPDYVPPKTLQQKYDDLNKKLDQLPPALPALPARAPRPGRAVADQRRLDQARASELKDVVPLSPAEKNQLRPVDADKLRRSDLDRRLDLDNVRPGIDEQSSKKREQPEVEYDDEYDAMVARVKKLAGLGPMKTVYDPKKRQYRNMPTAVQPKK
jgi:hypothetical protein